MRSTIESGEALTTLSYKKALIKAVSPERAGEAFRALHVKWAAEGSTLTVLQIYTQLRKFAWGGRSQKLVHVVVPAAVGALRHE